MMRPISRRLSSSTTTSSAWPSPAGLGVSMVLLSRQHTISTHAAEGHGRPGLRASAEFGSALPRVSYGRAWAGRLLPADHDQRAAGGIRINPARHGLIGEIARHSSFCPAIGSDHYLIVTTAHLAFGRARAGRANEAELR
jgi:hypothetical protein